MKAKTVWKAWNYQSDVEYWIEAPNYLWFVETADVRWLNCFGLHPTHTIFSNVASVRLVSGSKILGDSDES